jgi:hypothetical protein
MTDLKEMIEAVKAHALKNYEKNGWDFCVECWSDGDIADMIAESGASNIKAAIAAVRRTCSLLAERRQEVKNEVW